ncbi:MAG: type 1 glutamine amidotransferase [Candidatus Omnitrophica bacterium]|nr:type 1 glutamine amidotransferase [Candidatus Omnitrophota bacterium]MBU4488822.1 type 1 glutamine amidotransferase [Candidatus Omnitrophota bacterium]MCG2704712.1 type 1 glutamine amidotransferase [Candidatus Omnitrophota bacterium]
MIFVIQHVGIEGIGTLGEFFGSIYKDIKTVDLERGNNLPGGFKNIEAIIVLGGPMNVYEVDKYPFLKDEDFFLKAALKNNIPILGICLGAQLLAKSAGAAVKKASNSEIGWYDIFLTEDGIEDELFYGLDSTLKVFQWHEDTFEVPKEGTLLAASNICRNQAFKIGTNAYGLQFHIEITEDMIKAWTGEYLDNNDAALRNKAEKMRQDYMAIKDVFDKQARKVYLNFLKLIEGNKFKI